MSSGKILVTDHVHQLFIQEMESLGFEVDYRPKIDRGEVLGIVSQYVGLVINSKTIADKEMIDLGKQLIFIGRLGSGKEIMDIEYAASKGITCMNSPEGNRDAVAEQAIGMLLNLFNHLSKADREVKQGGWLREDNRGVELGGKTVSILGYGNTGSCLAKKLQGFDISAIAYDKYVSGFSNSYVKEVDMERVFKETDVLSLHLPLTDETEYLVNEGFLEKFEKPIYLVNTARGRHVKTSDLVKGLQQGKVLGAALDVLENEPPSSSNEDFRKVFNDLINLPNVILSPHIAGWTKESKEKIARVLTTKIKKLLSTK